MKGQMGLACDYTYLSGELATMAVLMPVFGRFDKPSRDYDGFTVTARTEATPVAAVEIDGDGADDVDAELGAADMVVEVDDGAEETDEAEAERTVH